MTRLLDASAVMPRVRWAIVRHAGVLALLALLAGLYLNWTWSDQLGSVGGDGAIYEMVARSYTSDAPAAGVTRVEADNTQFPPAYPLLLALGGGARDVRIAHALTTLCLLAAFAAFYVWLLTLGVGPGLSAATVAVFAALPGTFLLVLELRSEPLYLALTLVAVTALVRGAETGQPGAFWIASAAVAVALLARTAAVALVPVVALQLWRARPRAWMPMLAVAVLPALAWSAWHHPQGSYSEALLDHYREAGDAGIWAGLARNAEYLGKGFVVNMIQTPALFAPVLLVACCAIAGLAIRAARRESDALYVLAYVAMIVVWPYPLEASRFAWVIVPLLLGYLMWGAVQLAPRLAPASSALRSVGPWAALAIVGLVAATESSLAMRRHGETVPGLDARASHWPEWYQGSLASASRIVKRELALIDAVTELGAQVPPSECLASIKRPLVSFFGERSGTSPPPESADDAAFAAWLQHTPCRYYLLLAVRTPAFPTAYYPAARLGQTLEMISRSAVLDEGGQPVALLARVTR